MSVPEFQAFMAPVLQALSDGRTRHWKELRDPIADALAMSQVDREDMLPRGQSRFENRIQWSLTHLAQAGLLSRPERGHVRIEPRGVQLLAEHPDRIDMRLLSRFEEYRAFRARTRSADDTATASKSDDDASTPYEAIAEAVRESDEALASEVLQRVLDQEPVFLERLVLDLLTAMGYGGRAGAAEHLGGSGDGGIDGVVRQDVLGLDRVYVQAKRYSPDRSIGRPDLQAFVGALSGVQADRGVFITTSRFSAEATAFVERVPSRIVLIDGRRLAQLMILHNVGVQVENTFVLKRIDEDFFD